MATLLMTYEDGNAASKYSNADSDDGNTSYEDGSTASEVINAASEDGNTAFERRITVSEDENVASKAINYSGLINRHPGNQLNFLWTLPLRCLAYTTPSFGIIK